MKNAKRAPAVNAWLRRGLLIGLLAAAVYLGWGVWRPEPPAEVLPAPETVQADGRSSREAGYDKDRAALEELIRQSDGALKEQASQKLLQMVEEHQSELSLEETLREMGYSHAMVLVQNASVTVMVAQEQITTESAAALIALCMSHTGAHAENIRIMPLDHSQGLSVSQTS